MANAGNITVAVIADVGRFTSGMQESRKNLRGFEQNIVSATHGIKSMMSGFGLSGTMFTGVVEGFARVVSGFQSAMNGLESSLVSTERSLQSEADSMRASNLVAAEGIDAIMARASAELAAAKTASEAAAVQHMEAVRATTTEKKRLKDLKERLTEESTALLTEKAARAEQAALLTLEIARKKQSADATREMVAAAVAEKKTALAQHDAVVAALQARVNATKANIQVLADSYKNFAAQEKSASNAMGAANSGLSSATGMVEQIRVMKDSMNQTSLWGRFLGDFKSNFATMSVIIQTGFKSIGRAAYAATVKILAFTAAFISTPIGLVVTAIAAAAVAMYKLSTRTADMTNELLRQQATVEYYRKLSTELKEGMNSTAGMYSDIQTGEEKWRHAVERGTKSLAEREIVQRRMEAMRGEEARLFEMSHFENGAKKIASFGNSVLHPISAMSGNLLSQEDYDKVQANLESIQNERYALEKQLSNLPKWGEQENVRWLQTVAMTNVKNAGITVDYTDEELLSQKRSALEQEIQHLKETNAYSGETKVLMERLQTQLSDEHIAEAKMTKSVEERAKSYDQLITQGMTAEDTLAKAQEEYAQWLRDRQSLGMSSDPEKEADIQRGIWNQYLKNMGVNLEENPESQDAAKIAAIDAIIAEAEKNVEANQSYIEALKKARYALTDAAKAEADLTKSVKEQIKDMRNRVESAMSSREKYLSDKNELDQLIKDAKKAGITIDPQMVAKQRAMFNQNYLDSTTVGATVKQMEESMKTPQDALRNFAAELDQMQKDGVLIHGNKISDAMKKDLTTYYASTLMQNAKRADQNLTANLRGSVAAYKAEIDGSRESPTVRELKAANRLARLLANNQKAGNQQLEQINGKMVGQQIGVVG